MSSQQYLALIEYRYPESGCICFELSLLGSRSWNRLCDNSLKNTNHNTLRCIKRPRQHIELYLLFFFPVAIKQVILPACSLVLLTSKQSLSPPALRLRQTTSEIWCKTTVQSGFFFLISFTDNYPWTVWSSLLDGYLNGVSCSLALTNSTFFCLQISLVPVKKKGLKWQKYDINVNLQTRQ